MNRLLNAGIFVPFVIIIAFGVISDAVIQSPNYPSNYDNNINMSWILYPNYGSFNITLRFLDFITESCCDYVRFYNGTTASPSLMISQYYGNLTSFTVTFKASVIFMTFTTDYSVLARGFTTNFESTSVIQSPNYPNQYDNSISVSWLLYPNYGTNNITLRFLAFNTELCCDYVRFYNGTTAISSLLISAFNGNLSPFTVSFYACVILMQFTTDGSVLSTGFLTDYQNTTKNYTTHDCFTTTSTTTTQRTTTSKPLTTSTTSTKPQTTSSTSTIPLTTTTSTKPLTTSTTSTKPITTSTTSTEPLTTSTTSSIPLTSSTTSTLPFTSSTPSTVPLTSSTTSTIPLTSTLLVTSFTTSIVPLITATTSTVPLTSSTESTLPLKSTTLSTTSTLNIPTTEHTSTTVLTSLKTTTVKYPTTNYLTTIPVTTELTTTSTTAKPTSTSSVLSSTNLFTTEHTTTAIPHATSSTTLTDMTSSTAITSQQIPTSSTTFMSTTEAKIPTTTSTVEPTTSIITAEPSSTSTTTAAKAEPTSTSIRKDTPVETTSTLITTVATTIDATPLEMSTTIYPSISPITSTPFVTTIVSNKSTNLTTIVMEATKTNTRKTTPAALTSSSVTSTSATTQTTEAETVVTVAPTLPPALTQFNIEVGEIAAGASLAATLTDSSTFILQGLNSSMKESLGCRKEDMLLTCSYDGIPCDIENDFNLTYNPLMGNCFTFNAGLYGQRIVNRAGSSYGLKILLAAGQTDYSCTSTVAGFRIVIHENHVVPFPDVEGYNVPLGAVSSLSLVSRSVKRLGYPYGSCVSKQFGSFDGNYSVEACQRECYQKTLLHSCRCADPRYPLPLNAEYCTAKEKLCLDYNQQCEEMVTSSCNCPSPCNETLFYSTLSMAKLKSLEDVYNGTEFGDFVKECNGTHCTDFAMIYIYYQDIKLHQFTETSAYNIMSLLSDVAGVAGILFGLSIITFVEFAMIFALCTGHCYQHAL